MILSITIATIIATITVIIDIVIAIIMIISVITVIIIIAFLGIYEASFAMLSIPHIKGPESSLTEPVGGFRWRCEFVLTSMGPEEGIVAGRSGLWSLDL